MNEDLILTPKAAAQILMLGINAGRQMQLEELSKKPKYMSQREAYITYIKCRVKGWVEAGLLKPIHSGGGKNSKVLYDRATLMTLDMAGKVVFRKRRSFKEEIEDDDDDRFMRIPAEVNRVDTK